MACRLVGPPLFRWLTSAQGCQESTSADGRGRPSSQRSSARLERARSSIFGMRACDGPKRCLSGGFGTPNALWVVEPVVSLEQILRFFFARLAVKAHKIWEEGEFVDEEETYGDLWGGTTGNRRDRSRGRFDDELTSTPRWSRPRRQRNQRRIVRQRPRWNQQDDDLS